MFDKLCLPSCSNTCFCVNSMEFEDDEFESKPLIDSGSDLKLRLKDLVDGKQTLAFQLKPKVSLLFSFTFFIHLAKIKITAFIIIIILYSLLGL